MIPATAASRTRLLKKILADAGYEASVRSTPDSHRSQHSNIFDVTDPDAVAAYLDGYLGNDASVTCSEAFNDDATVNRDGSFVTVEWASRGNEECSK